MAKPKQCAECGAPRDGKVCTACGHEELRGGARATAGRPINEADTLEVKVGKGFATRVLSRVGELKLRFRVDETHPDLASGDTKKRDAARKVVEARIKAAPLIRNADDYCLDILQFRDAPARQLLNLLLAYRLGKPVQPVITADTRETAPELDFGDLIMPNNTTGNSVGKTKSQKASKPN